MPTRTVVLFSVGPAWVRGRGSRQQAHWDEHAAFIDDLTERGLLVAGGPFEDESGAMNILAGSPERADVERLYATDPFVIHGIFVLERAMAGVCRPLGVRIFTLTVAGRPGQTRDLASSERYSRLLWLLAPSNFGEDVIRTIRAQRAPRSYGF